MKTPVQQLAGFAHGVGSAPLPASITHDMRLRVLDTMGVAVGALPLETSRAALAHVAELGGAPQALAPGLEHPVPAPLAAFAFGVLAHSLDFDDTHLPSVLHPSASVVPAALATAQMCGADGATAAAAIAAGLEVCVRLGMAGYDRDAGNSLFFERGQHATSICGALGAAAASAKLLGLDAPGIAHAIGLAASMGSGVLEGNRSGGTVKRLHCGLAAQSGVTAAMLARRGFTAPATVLEGRFGFFQAWLDGRFDDAALLDGLGERWEIDRIFFKPYPANHFTHAAIDAALALRDKGVRPSDVERVSMGVAAPTVRTIGEPLATKRAPESGYQAQFSGPYAVAAALHGGSGLGLGLDDFTDALAADPSRRALMAKIEVHADPECDAIYPMQLPAILRVVTTDGTEHVERVLANRGGPDRPLDARELSVKFHDAARRALRDDAARAVEDAALRVDELPSARALLEPIAEGMRP